MKINLKKVIVDAENKPIGSTKEYAVVNEKNELIKENGQPLIARWIDKSEEVTVKKIIIASILAGEEKMTKEQKAADYMLFLKCAQEEDADFSTKEIERIKTVAGLHQGTLIYGQILDLFKEK